MMADFQYIFQWWFTLLLVSLIAWPLTFGWFKKFYDFGYIFTKTLSLVFLTFVLLVTGIFHILPFTNFAIASVILILFLINLSYFFTQDNLNQFLSAVARNYKIFLLEEVMFFLILTGWSYIRGFSPDIEGLEKFMDWGFVNSALRSTYLPPADMWFAGSPINYYYFGHLLVALITKLSGINSAITYNLAIASTCALTFVSGFSLCLNLIHLSIPKISFRFLFTGSLLAAFLLTFGGNLHPFYKILSNNIKNQGTLTLTRDALDTAINSYWYPDATRFIGFDPDIKDKTIHEFPVYSFVVADLHGHMNDIPTIILIIGLLLNFFAGFDPRKKVHLNLVLPLGFLLSIGYMTNAWDFAVYGLLFGISFWLISKNLTSTLTNGLVLIIVWFIFTLPFSLHFTPMAEGLKISDGHSPFYQLFVLYGGFWLIVSPFVIFFIKKLITNYQLLITDYFVLALIITATILIIIPELIYVKDIYIYEHRRANTMFKLVYQAFMLYSLASGYVLVRLRHILGYRFLFALVFVSHLIYPYFAVKSFYGLKEYKGLYGLNFLKAQYPDNYQAVNWINTHIPGQPVMLEAVGDSYTTFNQISVATGLPTIEGWIVHEWLWRGGYDKPSARQADVQKIYESASIDELKNLLTKYNVRYIFVGDKEVEKYPKLNIRNFDLMGATIIYQSGKTKIYQLP